MKRKEEEMKIKRKMKKRVLSLMLATCLISTMMPTVTFAEGTGTGKAIQLVDSGTAANIGGGQADNIYFGTYQQSSDGNGGYNTDPVKWRVLENADGQLFLLSDQNLDVFQYHTDWESVTWEKSTMRSWLNGYDASHNTGVDSGIDYTDDDFIDDAFSDKEQEAIADTYVTNEDNGNTEDGNNTTDKIFLLSIEEANDSSYFADEASRISTNTAYVAGGGKIGSSGMCGVGVADYWWLRSPGYSNRNAAYVLDSGGVSSNGNNVYNDRHAARPAFNLDLKSVLFTSAAVGGSLTASGMDSGLAAVGDYTGNEWKLTLLDSSRKFGVTEEIASGKPGDTITLHYTGATIGENEYISVIIANNSGAQYYGRVAQPTEPTEASGQIQIKIPASLADGTYTLNVFSEQYNGDYKTDYASEFQEISLTVTEYVAPSTPSGGGTVISKPTTSRIAGDDRFETAVEVADQLKKELGVTKFNAIVVAYSDEFADALSASAFAYENEAPVLVVNENNEEYVKKYIEQNLVKGGKVYIMGGNAVVTERFEESLSEYDVSRLGGDDRYETNLSTLKQLNLGGKDTIIIAYGLDYADALSASSTGLPVMIVGDKLTDSQIAYLKTLGGDDTYYIAGGTSAVSSEVEKQLKDLNLGTINRLAGDDRYETSVLIAETFYEKSTLAYLASGDDFPDGLTGGVLAGLSRDGKGAPLLLVNEHNTSLAASYIKDTGVRTVKAIGGTAAISEETLKAVI